MDIVRNPKINWLGLKWYFLGASLILGMVCLGSLLTRGMNWGVDFTGGTLVYIRFKDSPDLERVRTTLSRAALGAEGVTRFDEPAANEVQIRMARVEDEATEDLASQSSRVFEALFNEFDGEVADGRMDVNNATTSSITGWLQERDPESIRAQMGLEEFAAHTRAQAERMIDYRTGRRGIVRDMAELDQLGLPPPVLRAVKEEFYPGSFTILSVESVGPKVGRELRERAQNAVLFSLIGMLVYIAFRFRPIYGVAAIVAVFHDVFLTIGFFSLTEKEISLTVIAALLTLVGYSINDSIVIFDRVRENLKLMRRSDLHTVINTSINQTLNRTIMTSGMTFLAVFALFMLGGEALSGFSFALVVGIIVGTYSSVAIASPILIWWQSYREARRS